MKIGLIPIVAALAGCASTTSPFNSVEVLSQTRYVTRAAPDILRQLPPLPPRLPNPRAATNSQVATFISDTEEYAAQLEAQIRLLVRLYEAPLGANGTAGANGAAAPAPATPASAPPPAPPPAPSRARNRAGF
jgi:hypothetical protein